MRQVVDALVEGAAQGGPFKRTLLLVSGDHGQTLGGDHGGGSPEEVDSALVAVDIRSLAQQRAGGGASTAALGALLGAGGHAVPVRCRSSCTCGMEGNQCAPDLQQLDLTPTLAAMLGVPIPFGNLGKLSAELWQLTVGHLVDSGGAAASGAPGAVRAAWQRSLGQALAANARQVHTYLHTYAATAGAAFSRAALLRLDPLFAAATNAAASVADGTARHGF